MGVLVVCPKSSRKQVRSAVTNVAPLSWEEDGVITLLSIPDRRCDDEKFVTESINEVLPKEPALTNIIAVGDVKVIEGNYKNITAVIRAAGISSFKYKKDILKPTLEGLGQDWMTHLASKLRSWHHGPIDREHLNKWKRQFEKCGSYEWVGEKLLRILEFWTDTQLTAALKINEEGLKGFDCVSVNRHKRAGKSADAIASLVKKQLDSHGFAGINSDVLDFRDAIQTKAITKILFVEDCLISGNEMVRVFMALMGEKDPFGSSKADPLKDVTVLREKEIILRFAVVTNGGVAYVNRFLSDEGLTNIRFDLENVVQLDTHTLDGLSRIKANTLYDSDDCIVDIDQHIIRACFRPVDIWGSEDDAKRAMRDCAIIGRQLYKLYVEKRAKPKTDKQLDEASLGVRGLSLAIAFSHSVPKETLPLFWMGGNIEVGGRKPLWMPLFESGE
jgi:hypothetical protein